MTSNELPPTRNMVPRRTIITNITIVAYNGHREAINANREWLKQCRRIYELPGIDECK